MQSAMRVLLPFFQLWCRWADNLASTAARFGLLHRFFLPMSQPPNAVIQSRCRGCVETSLGPLGLDDGNSGGSEERFNIPRSCRLQGQSDGVVGTSCEVRDR